MSAGVATITDEAAKTEVSVVEQQQADARQESGLPSGQNESESTTDAVTNTAKTGTHGAQQKLNVVSPSSESARVPKLMTVGLYPQLPEPQAVVEPLAKLTEHGDSNLDSDVKHEITPLTDYQIASLYHNPQLKSNSEFIDAFLQVPFDFLLSISGRFTLFPIVLQKT